MKLPPSVSGDKDELWNNHILIGNTLLFFLLLK
jgi:hypothetical protein